MKKILLLLVCLNCLFFNSLNACEEPEVSMLFTIQELLQASNDVYLVKYSKKLNASRLSYKLVFEVIETIHGKHKDIVYYNHYNSDFYGYDSTTFNNHNDSTFWNKWMGRSRFECCNCTPDHNFKRGHIYLLFPEYYATRRHCERIISLREDKWLQYVRTFYKKEVEYAR